METMQIFWLIALVATGLFLVQFVMSIVAGDIDVDMDVDADGGMDLGDMFSLKGLTHFGIGFGWSMVLAGEMTWVTLAISIAIGLIFVWTLWKVYKFVSSLQKTDYSEKAEALVGREASIYTHHGDGRYIVSAEFNGAKREFTAVSMSGNTTLRPGEHVVIQKYEDAKYYIK